MFTCSISEVILLIPYTSNSTAWPRLSKSGSLYFIVSISSFCPPIFTIERFTLTPLSFSCFALALVMKQSEAALSHITLAVPFLVFTLCTWRRHVSTLESLHTLAEAEACWGVLSSFSWIDGWCFLVQPFTPQSLFILQVRCLWPGLRQAQHACFSLRKSLFSSTVLAW